MLERYKLSSRRKNHKGAVVTRSCWDGKFSPLLCLFEIGVFLILFYFILSYFVVVVVVVKIH